MMVGNIRMMDVMRNAVTTYERGDLKATDTEERVDVEETDDKEMAAAEGEMLGARMTDGVAVKLVAVGMVCVRKADVMRDVEEILG